MADARTKMVTDLLRQMSTRPNLTGYAYIRQAVLYVLDDPSYLTGITSRLYPAVAKRFNVDPSHVERNIRYCISDMQKRGDPAEIERICGIKNWQTATNTMFIAALAEWITVYGVATV